jgi:hypothetical protein
LPEVSPTYTTVSGSEEDTYDQGFKYVIKDIIFIMRIFTSILLQFFIPLITAILLLIPKWRKIAFDKKLLGLAIEKQC